MQITLSSKPNFNQCKKPTGLLGWLVAHLMNASHGRVTDWGLSHLSIEKNFSILDVGCGGGRTVSKLASMVPEGKVYGLDFSRASVAVASNLNRKWIQMGRVEIREGSVSEIPFPDNTFDLAVAIETHFWWPDLPGDVREALRVVKPGGTLALISEIYRNAKTRAAKIIEDHLPSTGMKLLTPEEHRVLLQESGFLDVRVECKVSSGWIVAVGKKP
jgi:ubiquinone/menaquinone biosynthesis C-methylase UbiE